MDRREFLKRSSAVAALPVYGFSRRNFGQTELQRKGPAKKIVVIGAGLAGLSAAYELKRAGHEVTILEAQTRAGGRVFTLRAPFSDGLYAEAGAMFVPDNHDLTLHYAKEFGLTLEPRSTANLSPVLHVRGSRFVPNAGQTPRSLFKLTPEEEKVGLGDFWQKCHSESVFEEIGDPANPGWSVESLKKYDQLSYLDFLRHCGASDEAISFLTLGMNSLWGEGLGSVSALTLLREMVHDREMEKTYTIKGGNDLLPRAFASRLADTIHYGCPVVRIEQSPREVKAIFLQAGSHHSITADRLICAIPFSVLRRIEISPRFSAQKHRAINELNYFSAARVSLQSRKRFWIDEGLSGSGRTDLPIGNVYHMTASQPGQRGILQAYLGGVRAREVVAMKENARVGFVLQHMEKLFPGIRDNFEGGVSKCWDEDEWERGASSWYRPGQMAQLWPHIPRSEGRVHFAGDHTSAWIRWMQGALHSGNRVAREVNDAV